MGNTIIPSQVQGNIQAEVLLNSILKQHSFSESTIGDFDVNNLLNNNRAVEALSMHEVENTHSSNDSFANSVALDDYTPWDWQLGGPFEAIAGRFEFGSVAHHTQIIEPKQSSLEFRRKTDHLASAPGDPQEYQQYRAVYDLHCHFAFSVDSMVITSGERRSGTSLQTLPLPRSSTTMDGSAMKHASDYVEEAMPSPLTVERSSSRDTKDHFLVMSKLSGMPYKEIKSQGHFREAESTLRGRFRSLTKSKAQRVRKPQWQERDVSRPVFVLKANVLRSNGYPKIQLLRQAVSQVAKKGKHGKATNDLSMASGHGESDQVPWKRVAEYIAIYGSYHFGNATCRKKWDEINGIGSKEHEAHTTPLH